MNKHKPLLVVHGGAWAIPDDMAEAHNRGVKAALAAGWKVLERGGSCLDAVEEAVVVMEEDDTFDAGKGSFHTRDASSHDTVGAVALDANGNIAAATSTGGTVNKTPGRVGDSSLIGCGCYADNLSAAVSCTGWGEPIMKLVLAKWAADQVLAGT